MVFKNNMIINDNVNNHNHTYNDNYNVNQNGLDNVNYHNNMIVSSSSNNNSNKISSVENIVKTKILINDSKQISINK